MGFFSKRRKQRDAQIRAQWAANAATAQANQIAAQAVQQQRVSQIQQQQLATQMLSLEREKLAASSPTEYIDDRKKKRATGRSRRRRAAFGISQTQGLGGGSSTLG